MTSAAGDPLRVVALLLAAALLPALASCTVRNDNEATLPTPRTAAPAGDRANDDVDVAEPRTPEADLFDAVTTEVVLPKAAFEIAIAGTVDVKAAGSATTRCLRGAGYLDVDVVAEPPLGEGDRSVASMTFGAPGYRGPGRYDARTAEDAEWTVALVDIATGETFEFYSPLDGADGWVTIADDGRSGSFDLRGLVDDEGAPISVRGSFACSVVEDGP